VSRTTERHVLGLALVMSVLASGATSSQRSPSADDAAEIRHGRGAVTASVSAETVPLGNTFELRVSLPVPPASAIYFPDELPATEAIESHGPVRWRAELAPDGATLRLTYPLIAFGTGNVRVPGLQVTTGPVSQVVGGMALPGGSVAVAGRTAQTTDRAPRLLASVAPREVHVASVFELEGVLAGVGPMPAADVIGYNWQALSLVLMFVLSSVLITVLAVTLRKLSLSSDGGEASLLRTPSSPEDARRAALRELDALLALRLHTNGGVREFYTSTSKIVRGYVERLDPRWGPGLTTTELVRELQARGDDVRTEDLATQLTYAEIVKFGRLRPEARAAMAHWRAVREWVEGSGEWDW